MKAKEYMARWENGGRTNEDLVSIANDFIEEISKIGKERNISTDEAFLSILDQQDAKWRAFARLDKDGEVRADGFLDAFHRVFPDIYVEWHFYLMQKKAIEFRKKHAAGGCEICQEALHGKSI